MIDEKVFCGLKYDCIFKAIVLNSEDYRLLDNILSDILEEKVKVENVESPELPVAHKNCKIYVLDVLVKTENEEYISVEINTKFDLIIKERNLKYYAYCYSGIPKRGNKYSKDNKVIQINLNFNGSGKKLKEEYLIKEKDTGEIYSNNFRIINVNVEKYKREWYDKNIKGNKNHIYMTILSADREELKELSKHDKLVKEVSDKMFIMNEDWTLTRLSLEEENKILESQWKELAREEGLKEGRKEGIKQKANDIAKNLLLKDFSLKGIAEITGLTEKEILKIKNRLEK